MYIPNKNGRCMRAYTLHSTVGQKQINPKKNRNATTYDTKQAPPKKLKKEK